MLYFKVVNDSRYIKNQLVNGWTLSLEYQGLYMRDIFFTDKNNLNKFMDDARADIAARQLRQQKSAHLN